MRAWQRLVTAAVATVIADRARLRAKDAEERLRLEEELRHREAERIRLQEVRASRARVINAADAERWRVVRELDDGAQQRRVQRSAAGSKSTAPPAGARASPPTSRSAASSRSRAGR
jgi:signal transduction histidine kinase